MKQLHEPCGVTAPSIGTSEWCRFVESFLWPDGRSLPHGNVPWRLPLRKSVQCEVWKRSPNVLTAHALPFLPYPTAAF